MMISQSKIPLLTYAGPAPASALIIAAFASWQSRIALIAVGLQAIAVSHRLSFYALIRVESAYGIDANLGLRYERFPGTMYIVGPMI